jgi:hypothetical protein
MILLKLLYNSDNLINCSTALIQAIALICFLVEVSAWDSPASPAIDTSAIADMVSSSSTDVKFLIILGISWLILTFFLPQAPAPYSAPAYSAPAPVYSAPAPVYSVPTYSAPAPFYSAPVGPVAPVGPFGLVGPLGPVGPVGPVAPFGPVSPLDPLGPTSPVCPFIPMGPGSPSIPFGSCGPVTPFGPVGPVSPFGPRITTLKGRARSCWFGWPPLDSCIWVNL